MTHRGLLVSVDRRASALIARVQWLARGAPIMEASEGGATSTPTGVLIAQTKSDFFFRGAVLVRGAVLARLVLGLALVCRPGALLGLCLGRHRTCGRYGDNAMS